MNYEDVKSLFFKHAGEWVCDSYSWGISYLAIRSKTELLIVDSLLHISPLPPLNTKSFSIEAGTLVAGREIIPNLTKAKILALLSQAAIGKLKANGKRLRLELTSTPEFYSEIPHKDSWYSELHLQVSGVRKPPPSIEENIGNEHALRCGDIPFDGVADLLSLLQLSDTRVSGQSPKIRIRIGPPADILFSETSLSANRLRLTLNAHPKLNTEKIALAIRSFPSQELEARKQISKSIVWARPKGGVRKGKADLALSNTDSVFAMLAIGGRTARRQWFVDLEKAVNHRYVATQLFDRELRQLKMSVLEPVDPDRFERGIASLLFLLGFSPAVQVESQAPDLIVATNGGKLALVECTLKISDFQSKLGKLVDRRNALLVALESNGQAMDVSAFLVCALPRAQIAMEDASLAHHQVTLLCKDDLTRAFDQLRIPKDPDAMLRDAAAALASQRHAVG